MESQPSVSRRRFLASGLAGAASTAAASLVAPAWAAPDRPSSAVDDDPPARVSALPAQTMDGFGASGAWWPNDLVTFDPAVQQQVADLLFSPNGIALSAYRYNIGGGGVGVTHPSHDPQTFLESPGAYDWSRDPGGRLFLRLAAEHGVPVLVGFVNSAPPVWTTTNRSNGGYLQPGAEDAFAGYLADIVAHFRDDEGIALTHLSPMNEPRHLFEGEFQEGMGVPVEQRAALVRAVGRALVARAPDCRVIADESSRTGEHFLHEVSQWLGESDTAGYVAALALHRYDFPNDLTLTLAREYADTIGKPIWSTEICCFDSRTGSWGQQYDPTIASGLMLANFIWQGLSVANDAAFHWWVACSPVMGCDPVADPEAAGRPNDDGWNDGLLYYDPNFRENGNQQIYTTARYAVLGQFSRYVRPGDHRHHARGVPEGLRVLAFSRRGVQPVQSPTALPPTAVANASPAPIPAPVQAPVPPSPLSPPPRPANDVDPAITSWSVVVINNGRAGTPPATLRLRVPLLSRHRLVPTAAVETSAARSLTDVPLPVVTDGLLTVATPAQSVTTVVLAVAADH